MNGLEKDRKKYLKSGRAVHTSSIQTFRVYCIDTIVHSGLTCVFDARISFNFSLENSSGKSIEPKTAAHTVCVTQTSSIAVVRLGCFR